MAVNRKCDECRNGYVAKRNDSKFCSPACRQRASRKGKLAEVVPLEPSSRAAEDDASPPAAGDGSGRRDGVYRATLAELEAAEAVETSLGQSALVMARRIDSWSPLDTGSSLASATKSLAELMAVATRGRAVADDPVDELRRRREERRRGA